MDKAQQRRFRRRRAHLRIRKKVSGTGDRPRLAVYKSLRYVYAQLIDDERGLTVAQASSLEPAIRSRLQGGSNKAAARLVGETLAERAKGQGIEAAVFDRGGYVFHGRVKELAEAARSKGLRF